MASSKGLVALAGTELSKGQLVGLRLGRFGGGADTGLGDEASGWLGRLQLEPHELWLVSSNGGMGALDGTEMGEFGWS